MKNLDINGMELIGKIIIIAIGIGGIVLLLLLMAAACELMAETYRETHRDEFRNDNYYDDDDCDDDDGYHNPYFTIKKIDGQSSNNYLDKM